jgi:hypothetical protein
METIPPGEEINNYITATLMWRPSTKSQNPNHKIQTISNDQRPKSKSVCLSAETFGFGILDLFGFCDL